MACFGSLVRVREQLAGLVAFGPVMSYLDELLRSDSAATARIRAVAPGETRRVELAGGAFALEQAYLTKQRSDGFFESHQRYIDVQIVIEGEETMEVTDIGRVSVTQPWDSERDLTIHGDTSSASLLRMWPLEAAVFHPADVHMPGLCGTAGPALVRKTVLKVPVEAANR